MTLRQRALCLCHLMGAVGGWLWLGLTGLALMLLWCLSIQRAQRRWLRYRILPGQLPPPVQPLTWVWYTNWAVVYPGEGGAATWIFADELRPREFAELRRELLVQVNSPPDLAH